MIKILFLLISSLCFSQQSISGVVENTIESLSSEITKNITKAGKDPSEKKALLEIFSNEPTHFTLEFNGNEAIYKNAKNEMQSDADKKSKPKLFLKPDSSSDSSSNSGDEESEQVNVTNNSSSIHNKHCRHSKDTVIHDQTSLSAMNPEAIVHNVPQNLPRDLKDIMKKAFKLKKKTNEKSDDSKESIDNNLILFRRKQKEDIFNENLFISFGQIVTHQHKMTYILKEDVKTETKSSEGNFLLLPLQLLMRDDVANSSSFIYVSALSQMYTYLLFCPDITKCPWVAEMLKKKCSYTSNKNVQCLLLLHSPTIIDMNDLQKAIDEADKDIVNDTDDEDYYKVGFNGDDEYWSSIVVVTGCFVHSN